MEAMGFYFVTIAYLTTKKVRSLVIFALVWQQETVIHIVTIVTNEGSLYV